jgi:hypothetical protein
MNLLKIRNLKHKYGGIRIRLPRKANGAQSSIEMSCIWEQNAQSNLGVSLEKKIIDMCHILK